jgi:hypothetical protein
MDTMHQRSVLSCKHACVIQASLSFESGLQVSSQRSAGDGWDEFAVRAEPARVCNLSMKSRESRNQFKAVGSECAHALKLEAAC